MTTTENRTLSRHKTRARDAFASILAQIRAVQESSYLAITADIRLSVATVIRAWPQIRLLRSQFIKQLPEFPISQFDSLETYALALLHSQALYEQAIVPRASLVDLARRARKSCDRLWAELDALDNSERRWTTSAEEPKGTKGYKKLKEELEIVVLLLQRKLAKATPLIGITEDDVNQANALAEELEAATAEHEQCPDVPRQIDCDRRAAFTLFMNAYPRVRVAIAYLRCAEGDADFIAPPLHTRRTALQKEPLSHAGRKTCGRFSGNPAQPASPSVDASMTLTGWSDPSKGSPFKA